MKGQVSRISQDRLKLYSAVFQNQGAMVTDADLGEASFIARARVDELGDGAIGSGAPADGGVVQLLTGNLAALRPGLVYAEGVRGTVRLRTGATLTAAPLDLYAKQQDFPSAPALPASDQVVYADVWHQERFPLLEPGLVDPGFHGAETSFRSRTVAQLKVLPPGDRALLGQFDHAYPRKGDGLLEAAIRTGAAAIDPCDPCATVVGQEARLGNALFRVEVLKATGPADEPGNVTIAWSVENAAEQQKTSPRPASAYTARPGSVFEFFSEVTEAHKGAFADPATRRHSQLLDAYPATVPASNDGVNANWPYVRRWDGYAVVNLAGSTPVVSSTVGGAGDIDAGRVRVTLTDLVFHLTLTDKRVMVGDYWLVEVREFASGTDRVRVVSPTPIGIEHHYAALFAIRADGTVVPLSDADRRAATFPTLSDIPADHVGYENHCTKLYGPDPRINVQQALDALCGIEAADIAFTNNCPQTFDSATNVQEALDALCNIDFSPRVGYRLLFDWGVLCGLRLGRQNEDGDALDGWLTLSPGAFLDRTGRLMQSVKVPDFNVRTGQNINFEVPKPTDGKAHEYCLALLAHDDQSVTVHVVDKNECKWREDRTYEEAVEACEKPNRGIRGKLEELVATRKSKVTDKFLMAATAEEPVAKSYRLSKTEEAEITALVGEMHASIKSSLSSEQSDWLDQALAQADIDHNPQTAGPAAADNRRGWREIEKIKVVAGVWGAVAKSCDCEHYFPSCPEELNGRKPYVPIGCITLSGANGQLLIKVCEFCCRRQALTPRTFRYWAGEQFLRKQAALGEKCCTSIGLFAPERPKPGDGLIPWDPKIPIPWEIEPNVPGPWDPNPPDPVGPWIWTTNPKVDDLGREPAIQVLQGHGLDVTEVIDMDAGDPFETLVAKGMVASTDRLTMGGKINPGDKVALLTQNGVSRGYVVLERGVGRYAFATQADKVKPTLDLSDIDRSLADAREQKSLLLTDLSALEVRRDSLKDVIGGLRTEIDGMRTLQEDIAGRIRASAEGRVDIKLQVEELAAQRDRLKVEVDSLRRSVVDTKAEQDKVIAQAREQIAEIGGLRDQLLISLREAHPVSVVIGEQPALAESLRKANVTTVGELSKLPDAERTKIFEEASIKPTERKVILRALDARLKPGG